MYAAFVLLRTRTFSNSAELGEFVVKCAGNAKAIVSTCFNDVERRFELVLDSFHDTGILNVEKFSRDDSVHGPVEEEANVKCFELETAPCGGWNGEKALVGKCAVEHFRDPWDGLALVVVLELLFGDRIVIHFGDDEIQRRIS